MKMGAFKPCVALTLSVLLAACGGGGSGSTPVTQPPVAQPPAPDTSLQTSVPSVTYAPGSLERQAYDVINNERVRCGVGAIAQNTYLDKAASNHANYVELRFAEGVNPGHTEDPSKTGFTGVTGSDRALAAGYTGVSYGENLSFTGYYYLPNTNYIVPPGEAMAYALFNTVYHAVSLFDNSREVGVGIGLPSPNTTGTFANRAVLAWQPGIGKGAAGQVPTETIVSFPCQGTTGVLSRFAGESPDPFAGVNMGSYTSLGHPIYVYAPRSKDLTVSSASLTAGNGTVVPVFIYTKAVDPQKRLTSTQVFLIPLAALATNTTYTAQFSGTADAVPFAKAIQFTTGKL